MYSSCLGCTVFCRNAPKLNHPGSRTPPTDLVRGPHHRPSHRCSLTPVVTVWTWSLRSWTEPLEQRFTGRTSSLNEQHPRGAETPSCPAYIGSCAPPDTYRLQGVVEVERLINSAAQLLSCVYGVGALVLHTTHQYLRERLRTSTWRQLNLALLVMTPGLTHRQLNQKQVTQTRKLSQEDAGKICPGRIWLISHAYIL
ncbi:hypothetical protein BDV96DRAFT_15076 [Lophiotrema nucula]|uniref:Uncharacterized protein n=1 Tax=Lophiotrema nucula TaxID=690887 RepID=A0A6A5ZVU3_9PLEO|nr:hypothetical protein BDV96DRAFT_15076 [Lophiotrema nucula]